MHWLNLFAKFSVTERTADISILLTRRHTNWLEDIACLAGVEFGDWKAVEVWPGFERVAWCI